ncbi:MAG: hypothetical protein RSB99_01350 [Bacilli bacterium]
MTYLNHVSSNLIKYIELFRKGYPKYADNQEFIEKQYQDFIFLMNSSKSEKGIQFMTLITDFNEVIDCLPVSEGSRFLIAMSSLIRDGFYKDNLYKKMLLDKHKTVKIVLNACNAEVSEIETRIYQDYNNTRVLTNKLNMPTILTEDDQDVINKYLLEPEEISISDYSAKLKMGVVPLKKLLYKGYLSNEAIYRLLVSSREEIKSLDAIFTIGTFIAEKRLTALKEHSNFGILNYEAIVNADLQNIKKSLSLVTGVIHGLPHIANLIPTPALQPYKGSQLNMTYMNNKGLVHIFDNKDINIIISHLEGEGFSVCDGTINACTKSQVEGTLNSLTKDNIRKSLELEKPFEFSKKR